MNSSFSSPEFTQPKMDRRRAMQWLLAATAATTVTGTGIPNAQAIPWTPAGSVVQHTPVPKGYGTDPNLSKLYKPGDLWPLTLSDSQRANAAILCDLIFPADEIAPSASSLHVHDFIDEWISAPYPETAADRQPVLDCIAWFESESQKRFQCPLAKLPLEKLHALADDVAYKPKSNELKKPCADFSRFKFVAAGGFYTTPEGMKDIGFIGNVPTVNFDGPTPEALKHVGLA